MSCLRILGVKIQAVDVDAQRHQHTQASLDGLPRFAEYCQLLLYDVEKAVQHCDEHESCVGCRHQSHCTMKLGVDEICAAGSSTHWTGQQYSATE